MLTLPDVLSWLGATVGDPNGHIGRVWLAVEEDVSQHTAYIGLVRPEAIDLAVLMLTSRLWKRKSTPEGIMSFEGNGVIRVGAYDADVERLLAPYRVWNFA